MQWSQGPSLGVLSCCLFSPVIRFMSQIKLLTKYPVHILCWGNIESSKTFQNLVRPKNVCEAHLLLRNWLFSLWGKVMLMIQHRPVAKLWAMAAPSSLFDRSPLIRVVYKITSNSHDYHINMSILWTFKFELWQRLAWRSCLNHFAILCISVFLVWKKYSSDCLHVCDANLDTCREGKPHSRSCSYKSDLWSNQ